LHLFDRFQADSTFNVAKWKGITMDNWACFLCGDGVEFTQQTSLLGLLTAPHCIIGMKVFVVQRGELQPLIQGKGHLERYHRYVAFLECKTFHEVFGKTIGSGLSFRDIFGHKIGQVVIVCDKCSAQHGDELDVRMYIEHEKQTYLAYQQLAADILMEGVLVFDEKKLDNFIIKYGDSFVLDPVTDFLGELVQFPSYENVEKLRSVVLKPLLDRLRKHEKHGEKLTPVIDLAS
jgi:hypothetical protein